MQLIMKTRLKMAVGALLLILFCTSQTLEDPEVKGLRIYQKYTKQQILSALGQPTRYDTWGSGAELGQEFYYGESLFHFEDNGFFKGFIVYDPEYLTMTDLVPGGVRVGDPISKILSRDNLVIKSYPQEGTDCDTEYCIRLDWWDDLYVVYVKNGRITSIGYFVSC